jgi:serine/threonine-protein kinase
MNKATAPSDFVADLTDDPKKCPQCGAITQFNHGTCINCLLREGLEAKGEASREAFENILAEANVTDNAWRLGHYEILEEIGRGGMGVIYRARQRHSRRIVAVKRIFAHEVNSHDTLERFRREAEAVASLDHPNILPIYEVSESEEGLPYFSMKYATGGSLRDAAAALRKDPRKCVHVMAKVARAVAYAHGKGVLHRDLQPGNSNSVLPSHWAAAVRGPECSFRHSSSCCDFGATAAFTSTIPRPRSGDNRGSLFGERS